MEELAISLLVVLVENRAAVHPVTSKPSSLAGRF
jgi:hypothetical protein